MSQFRQYYGSKIGWKPQITVEQYPTRKVKGNGNIRSFLALTLFLTVLCGGYYVLIG